MLQRIVIIGAGQAGASVASKLRALGHTGQITMIGEEPDLPYERPPLSKAYLLGKLYRERLYLRPKNFYIERNIEVLTSTRAIAINLAQKQVALNDSYLSYDVLVLTTGAVPRSLPSAIGGNLSGVHVLRNIADVDTIVQSCRTGVRALIVGGGYIGLEAAAVFRSLGMSVTLLEQSDRILQRVASKETSDYFRVLHKSHGVEIRESITLSHLTGDPRVSGAVLRDGSTHPVELVVVGIGVTANDVLAKNAGLETNNGVVVDASGRSSDAAVWAAGDCTVFPWEGRFIQLESVQNAVDQATVVAQNILGMATVYTPVPWFWSDQYGAKLQIAGLNMGYDRVVVRPGKKVSSVSHWYFSGDRFLSVDAMNDPRSYMFGRRLLESGRMISPAQISDPHVCLKELISEL